MLFPNNLIHMQPHMWYIKLTPNQEGVIQLLSERTHWPIRRLKNVEDQEWLHSNNTAAVQMRPILNYF